MTSGSPQIVLFVGDAGGWHRQAEKGKRVSTLRIRGILGIDKELNAIYDRQEGALKSSFPVTFSWASSLEQLPNCYAWWISCPQYNPYVSVES